MNRPNIFINCRVKSSVKIKIMKKWIKRCIKYYRKPSNEFGFMVLSLHKKWTTLPTNILIDDGELWTNIGNKKILLIQVNNSKQVDFDKVIPMSIEENPQILYNKDKIELTDSEMEQIKYFIINCKEDLIQISIDNDHLKFYDKLESKGFYNRGSTGSLSSASTPNTHS